MYEIIGFIVVNGVWIALLLVAVSLVFGYIALERRIILYSFFANVLDFFYMPLRAIYVYLGKRKDLDAIMVELKNKANKKRYEQSKKRMLLAPHCLRAIDCPAPSTREGILCKSCGKCPYTEIKKVADGLGIKLRILTGSSAVKYIIKTEKFDSALLLACNYELNKVMRYLTPNNIASYGVPLTKDGCYSTELNLKALFDAMKMGLCE